MSKMVIKLRCGEGEQLDHRVILGATAYNINNLSRHLRRYLVADLRRLLLIDSS